MKDNELITRKNIELALLNKGQHSRRYKLGDIWELNYDEIREVLDGVNADVQHVRWIPVTERLPEVGTYVLISKKALNFRSNLPSVCTAHRSCDPRSGKEEWNYMLFGKPDDDDVLAWMPLPEPYREEGEHDGNQH